MQMKRLVWVVLCLTGAALAAFAAACGGSGDEGAGDWEPYSASDPSSGIAMAPPDEALEPIPTPSIDMRTEAMEEVIAAAVDPILSVDEFGTDSEITAQPASYTQDRIIVHTARMSLVVDDVADTVSRITDLSTDLGGWVVSSNRFSLHSGAIVIRVPAGSLTEAFQRIEVLALDVESREMTSQDVTDEFVDTESRLKSLRATRQRLLSFLDQATDVEDALLVEKELSALEERMEQMQGRINYLSQTSAFSLIEVNLKLSPVDIDVDPGPDVSVRVGQAARFQASFRAPQGIDDYSFVWDFGDGASVAGKGSIPRPNGTMVTATVHHVYEDDRDSPHIVTVDLTGTGEEGAAEGSASLEVTVQQVPTIEVFAGQDRTVEEGDDVGYSASFTRPSELWDYEFQWDFGDGSTTLTGKPEEGSGRIEASHSFSDYRTRPYEVMVTVSAMSDAGRVKGTDSFTVQVTEVEGFVVGGWDVGETAKTAVRALSAVGKVALTALIWVGIFSPVVLLIGGALILLRRYRRRAHT